MFKQRPTPRFRMEVIAILLILPATAGRVSAEKQFTYADLVARLTTRERLATPVVPGEKTFASTSHDRGMSYDPSSDTYRNWSANRDGGGCIRREGDAQVMVDLKGLGVLWRTWPAKAGVGHIKISLDGKPIAKPIDFYDPKVTTSGEVSLGTVQLDKGTHVLKATAIGHNEKSKDTHAGNHIFGLDYLRLK